MTLDPTLIVIVISSLFTNLALCFGKIRKCKGCGGFELELQQRQHERQQPTKSSTKTSQGSNTDNSVSTHPAIPPNLLLPTKALDYETISAILKSSPLYNYPSTESSIKEEKDQVATVDVTNAV
jgi:hypothetical protein